MQFCCGGIIVIIFVSSSNSSSLSIPQAGRRHLHQRSHRGIKGRNVARFRLQLSLQEQAKISLLTDAYVLGSIQGSFHNDFLGVVNHMYAFVSRELAVAIYNTIIPSKRLNLQPLNHWGRATARPPQHFLCYKRRNAGGVLGVQSGVLGFPAHLNRLFLLGNVYCSAIAQ